MTPTQDVTGFLDLTRLGCPLKLDWSAVLYLEAAEERCLLHLASGHDLLVDQSFDEVSHLLEQAAQADWRNRFEVMSGVHDDLDPMAS